jgi:hypothetical protein
MFLCWLEIDRYTAAHVMTGEGVKLYVIAHLGDRRVFEGVVTPDQLSDIEGTVASVVRQTE